MAQPIDPMAGDESKVEQTLSCRMGAPSAASDARAGARCSRIQAGDLPRAWPARPTARTPGKRASSAGVGTCRHSTVGTPAVTSASSASVLPVKSSP